MSAPYEPPQRRPSLRIVAMGLVCLVVVAGAISFLTIRPDLPARSGIAPLMQFAHEGRLISLELDGSTLIAGEVDGSRLRAENVTAVDYQALVAAATGANLTRGRAMTTRVLNPSFTVGSVPWPPVLIALLILSLVSAAGWRVVHRRSGS